MAELLGRKPIFPGKDYVQQLNLITQVCIHTHFWCMQTTHSSMYAAA